MKLKLLIKTSLHKLILSCQSKLNQEVWFLYLCVCLHVYMWVGAHECSVWEDQIQQLTLDGGVPGACELPDVRAGNWTQSSASAVETLHTKSLLQTPQMPMSPGRELWKVQQLRLEHHLVPVWLSPFIIISHCDVFLFYWELTNNMHF